MQRTRTKPERIAPRERGAAKIQRNQKCPCNSGKKYKNCHGSQVRLALQGRVIEERKKQ